MIGINKITLFRLSFVGAAILYSWAIVSLWIGPRWSLSGPLYLFTGVLPAFFGVLCTISALALHLEIQEDDSASSGDF